MSSCFVYLSKFEGISHCLEVKLWNDLFPNSVHLRFEAWAYMSSCLVYLLNFGASQNAGNLNPEIFCPTFASLVNNSLTHPQKKWTKKTNEIVKKNRKKNSAHWQARAWGSPWTRCIGEMGNCGRQNCNLRNAQSDSQYNQKQPRCHQLQPNLSQNSTKYH